MAQQEEALSRDLHRLDDGCQHHQWRADIAPRLTVDPGAIVEFTTSAGIGARYTAQSVDADVLRRPPGPVGLSLTGPVYVRGAEPGDCLEIDVLGIDIADWGYTVVSPEMGLLKDEFPFPVFRSWDLSSGTTARMGRGIAVPIDPFLGTIGVAPPHGTVLDSIPPSRWGGNLDTRQLNAGARLWLPVAVEGALLSVGDAHAAQGDGEVCGSAIETTARARLRIGVRKGVGLAAPEFETGQPDRLRAGGRSHATMGVGPNLMEAARNAIRAMIRYLGREHGLAREDAYVLCSVAVDLRISEIVDAPNWIVSAFLPLDLFATGNQRESGA
jgi:acetamidase/formamidase